MQTLVGTDTRCGTTRPLDRDQLNAIRTRANIFPLSSDVTPVGGIPLSAVSDEDLLFCPPHLIAHMQRTAAQGGLQVVSPRQTPFSSLMLRKAGTKRHLGDHDVGSVCDPTNEWPTLPGDEIGHLLPDAPLPSRGREIAVRPKTKTRGLVKGDIELSDPVLACLVKGRAVIDILARDDVAGGDVELTDLLAEAWGVSVEDIRELGSYTLGVQGPLHRHAIKTDDVYPTLYAPVQYKHVITVGTADLDKSVLPPDTGMDWRRSRVFCEAVFYNSCCLEGLPIKYMRGLLHPADPTSPPNKPGTMTFYPAPASAWSYAPSTFSVCPTETEVPRPRFKLPVSVRDALQKYTRNVRPVTYLLDSGHSVDVWLTTARRVDQVVGETLTATYGNVLRAAMTGSAKGRTAASTVRNVIYESLEGAALVDQMRLARIINVVADEWKLHFGTEKISPEVVQELGFALADVGTMIRDRVARECMRRGKQISEWWDDIRAQAPQQYLELKEGTLGWAVLGLWHCISEPTWKWGALRKAIKFSALRDAERTAIGGMALPPEMGTAERLLSATQLAVQRISAAYTGHYRGVMSVGLALANEAKRRNLTRLEDALREGAYLWMLRSRSLRGTNVHAQEKGLPKESTWHLLVRADPVDIVLKPAPYRAFFAWTNHISKSRTISTAVKKQLTREPGGAISEVFTEMTRSILPCRESLVTKYLLRPNELGYDMEKGWAYLCTDVEMVARRINAEAERRSAPVPMPQSTSIANVVVQAIQDQASAPRQDYFEVLCTFDPDVVDGIEAAIDKLERWRQEEITQGAFADGDALLAALSRHEAEVAQAATASAETVR